MPLSRVCASRFPRSPTGVRRRTARRPDLRVAAVALAVGLVLADASVVILALPAIYREFNAEVADVAWVVTAFNLALALAAVPAARLSTRRPAGRVCAGGLALFACASAACALAPCRAWAARPPSARRWSFCPDSPAPRSVHRRGRIPTLPPSGERCACGRP